MKKLLRRTATITLLFICIQHHTNIYFKWLPLANALKGAPPPPKDIQLLPVSNTELDVDIIPEKAVVVKNEPTGEPTRYNISYEFRIWKNKTKVQEIKIRQKTGVVISFMRMHSPPYFAEFKNKPMEVVDYVFELMRDHSIDANAPLDTCKSGLCSYGLRTLSGFKNEIISSYDVVYHGCSHFVAGYHDERSFSNTWEIVLEGNFRQGAILAINQRIIASSVGESGEEKLRGLFTIRQGWNILEFYAFEACCQRQTISMKYRKQTQNQTWTDWKVWGKENIPMTGTTPPFGPYRNVRHLRALPFNSPYGSFRLGYNSLFTQFVPFNATARQIYLQLHTLNTTGFLMVTREDTSAKNLCDIAGWCTWQITFVTNVLYERPHLDIHFDDSKLSYSDPDVIVNDLGHIDIPDDYTIKYAGKRSITPSSLGPTIPRRFRLSGVTGAKYLPFTIGVRSRNFVGYGQEKIMDAGSPDAPEAVDGDLVNDRQINLKIRGPRSNNGAMVTKYIVKWQSMETIDKMVQRIKFNGQDLAWETKIDEFYNASESAAATNWQRGYKLNSTCGKFSKIAGGYNIIGKGATIYRQANLPEHTGIKVDFDLILIDEWTGSTIYVFLDGIQVWQRRPHLIHDDEIVTSECGRSQFSDRLVHVTFQQEHKLRSLEITIQTSLNVSPSTASFGLQGFNVSYTTNSMFRGFNDYVFPSDKNELSSIRSNEWQFKHHKMLNSADGTVLSKPTATPILGKSIKSVQLYQNVQILTKYTSEASLRLPFCPENYDTFAIRVVADKYIYATMDRCLKNCESKCQSEYLSLPDGWELAPLDSGVVKSKKFETDRIIVESGYAFYVDNYGAVQQYSDRPYIEQKEDAYRSSVCDMKILMRLKCGLPEETVLINYETRYFAEPFKNEMLLVDGDPTTYFEQFRYLDTIESMHIKLDLKYNYAIETVRLEHACDDVSDPSHSAAYTKWLTRENLPLSHTGCDRYNYDIFLLDDIFEREDECREGAESCRKAGGRVHICLLSGVGNCFRSDGEKFRFVMIVFHFHPYVQDGSRVIYNRKLHLKLHEIEVLARSTVHRVPPTLHHLQEEDSIKTWPVSRLDLQKSSLIKQIQIKGSRNADRNEWLRGFKLMHSLDGLTWTNTSNFATLNATCPSYTKAYCEDPTLSPSAKKGCYPMLQKGDDKCIFNFTNFDSPCHFKDCVLSPTSKSCQDKINEYCVLYGSDVGCNPLLHGQCQSGTSNDPLCSQGIVVSRKVCRFRIDVQSSPCLQPVCINNFESYSCREVIRNYCKTVSGLEDGGCFLPRYPARNCAFNINVVGTPCLHHHCLEKGVKSIDCRDYIKFYCENIDFTDPGCKFGIIASNLPTCPFGSETDSPCYNSICMKDGYVSWKCRTIVRLHCSKDEKVNTAACSGGQAKSKIKTCPFPLSETSSPCYNKNCRLNGTNIMACREAMRTYCQPKIAAGLTQADKACNLGDIRTNITCPYAGSSNPCTNTNCYPQGSDSIECRKKEKDWCTLFPDGAGCLGGIIDTSTVCPFNKSRSDSPCQSLHCVRAPWIQQSAECNATIIEYCKTYREISATFDSVPGFGTHDSLDLLKDGDINTIWTIKAKAESKNRPSLSFSFPEKYIVGVEIHWLHPMTSYSLEWSNTVETFHKVHEKIMPVDFNTTLDTVGLVLSLRASDYLGTTGTVIEDAASKLSWIIPGANFIITAQAIVMWNTGNVNPSYSMTLQAGQRNLFPGPYKTPTNVTVIPKHTYTLIAWVKGLSSGEKNVDNPIFGTQSSSSNILSRKLSGSEAIYTLTFNGTTKIFGEKNIVHEDSWEILVLKANDVSNSSSAYSLFVGDVNKSVSSVGEIFLPQTTIHELQLYSIVNCVNGWNVLDVKMWVSNYRY